MNLKLSKADLARLFSVNPRTISEWQKQPGFPQPEQDGRSNVYNASAILRWWHDRELSKLVDGGELDLATERARLAKEQADKTALENKRLRGELVHISEPIRLLEKTLMAFRSRVLAAPTKAAPLVHGCATLAETRDAIENALHDALEELSQLDFSQLNGGCAS